MRRLAGGMASLRLVAARFTVAAERMARRRVLLVVAAVPVAVAAVVLAVVFVPPGVLVLAVLAGAWLVRRDAEYAIHRLLGRRSDAATEEPAGDGPTVVEAVEPAKELPAAPTRPASGGGYRLPPLDLLPAAPARRPATGDALATADAITGVLGQFVVNATIASRTCGPAVTRYELGLGPKTKPKAVVDLTDSLSLAVRRKVRVALLVERGTVGVEVPNTTRALVGLGDLLRCPAAAKDRHPLLVGLGVEVDGTPVLANLARMPHLLIAGATSTGKSVSLNVVLTSVLVRATPEQVGLLLLDPKQVELAAYADVPHLVAPIVTDPRKAAQALESACAEMDRRYATMATAGVKHIDRYNATHPDRPLSYLLIVVDELADLILIAKDETEASIVRLAQLGRAAGVHLVLATQRPDRDVLTGLIKANVPSRLAFTVTDATNSRIILDRPGAERLAGEGDALYLPLGAQEPRRIQGAWVTDAEVAAVVEHCTDQRGAVAAAAPTGLPLPAGRPAPAGPVAVPADPADDLDLLAQAIELVVTSQFGSTSMLQRKLRIGYAKAGRLMDALQARGIVGPSDGSKARDVLIDPDDLDEVLDDLGAAPVEGRAA